MADVSRSQKLFVPFVIGANIVGSSERQPQKPKDTNISYYWSQQLPRFHCKHASRGRCRSFATIESYTKLDSNRSIVMKTSESGVAVQV
jgi:hypothetical protein